MLWNIADAELSVELNAIKAAWAAATSYTLHLFKNNYTPVPGESLGSYTEADFTGYAAATIDKTAWGSSSVSAHIASITNSVLSTFTAGSGMVGTQDIYGYYVLDGSSALAWGERFTTMRTLQANDVLKVQAIFRYRNAES